MKTHVLLMGVAMLTGAVSAEGADLRRERFSGEARSSAGAVVYREKHELQWKGAALQSAVTRYYDPEGKLIGELHSRYGDDPWAPDYKFVDAEGRLLESARRTERGIELRYRGNSQLIAVHKDEPAPIVLGQGFNAWACAHLETLAAGEKKTVLFAIPSRQETYPFRVQKVGNVRPDVLRLDVAIDDWLLAMIAPSLEVTYDRRNQRLLEYRGVSNIEDANGDTQKVHIVYQYPEDERSPEVAL